MSAHQTIFSNYAGVQYLCSLSLISPVIFDWTSHHVKTIFFFFLQWLQHMCVQWCLIILKDDSSSIWCSFLNNAVELQLLTPSLFSHQNIAVCFSNPLVHFNICSPEQSNSSGVWLFGNEKLLTGLGWITVMWAQHINHFIINVHPALIYLLIKSFGMARPC